MPGVGGGERHRHVAAAAVIPPHHKRESIGTADPDSVGRNSQLQHGKENGTGDVSYVRDVFECGGGKKLKSMGSSVNAAKEHFVRSETALLGASVFDDTGIQERRDIFEFLFKAGHAAHATDHDLKRVLQGEDSFLRPVRPQNFFQIDKKMLR